MWGVSEHLGALWRQRGVKPERCRGEVRKEARNPERAHEVARKCADR
jgi:hypothetical protein